MADRTEHGLVASVDDARAVLDTLREKAEADSEFMDSFRSNPGFTLGNYGLAKPVQEQILSDAGLISKRCSFVSCVCSGCGITLSF